MIRLALAGAPGPARASHALGAERTPQLEDLALEEMRRGLAGGSLWVLNLANELVATTSFNAETRGVVQVGSTEAEAMKRRSTMLLARGVGH